MILNDLLSKVEGRRARKRCGRGRGSGLGKTSGRGHKGAASRSGFKLRLSYEGGQVSLIRHLPKRGFTNHPFRRKCDVVNLDVLEESFEGGAAVGLDDLVSRGLLDPQHGRLKILGNGSVSKPFRITAWAISRSARQKIEAAGGTVELLGPPPKKRKAPHVPKAAPLPKAASVASEKPAKGGGKRKGAPTEDDAASIDPRSKGGEQKASSPRGKSKSATEPPEST